VPITAANRSGTRADVMAFNINLTGGTLPQLPAATYTGTLKHSGAGNSVVFAEPLGKGEEPDSRPCAVFGKKVKNATAETIRNGGSAGAGCALLVASGTPARAQVLNSAASPIALRAVLSQSLTVTLSGNAVNFNLVSAARTIQEAPRLPRPPAGFCRRPWRSSHSMPFLRTQAPR